MIFMANTRPIEGPQDFTCPTHQNTVEHRPRWKTDEESGRKRYAGEYLACPQYAECGYYVSPGSKRVPIMGEDGVALGRSEK